MGEHQDEQPGESLIWQESLRWQPGFWSMKSAPDFFVAAEYAAAAAAAAASAMARASSASMAASLASSAAIAASSACTQASNVFSSSSSAASSSANAAASSLAAADSSLAAAAADDVAVDVADDVAVDVADSSRAAAADDVAADVAVDVGVDVAVDVAWAVAAVAAAGDKLPGRRPTFGLLKNARAAAGAGAAAASASSCSGVSADVPQLVWTRPVDESAACCRESSVGVARMGLGGPSGSALNWTMPSKLPRPSCCWPAAAPSSSPKDVSCSISRLPVVDCRESAARDSTAAYWSRSKLGCRCSGREDAAGAAACDGDPSCSTSLAGDGELLVKESSEAEPEDRRSRNCAPRRGVFGESSASNPSIVSARFHGRHCRPSTDCRPSTAPAALRNFGRDLANHKLIYS